MVRLTRRGFLAGAAAGLALPPQLARASGALDVVATTGMIADAARTIGGDAVSVRALMGPGIDPHAYRQTRSDIVAMARADLVLWHGLYLEAQMEAFLLELAEDKPVLAVAETLPEDLLIPHDDYDGRFDPHVWMDPSLWKHVATSIATALEAARPELADALSAARATHLAEIGAIGAYSEEMLAKIPEERRMLVTAHDAFNYFGSAYGFEVVGIQGISTESEAGLRRIADLVDLLVDRKIGAVFVESSVSDRNMRALVEGAEAKGHQVSIGGTLFSDAMGPEGTYEGTYVGMIDHNVTTIARALGGDAPERGFSGRLATL